MWGLGGSWGYLLQALLVWEQYTFRSVSSHIIMATNIPLKLTKPKKGGVSPVWDCVTLHPEDESSVICNKCKDPFSRGRDRAHYSTSAIMDHLRQCNPVGLSNAKKIRAEAAKKKEQQRIDKGVHTYFNSTPKGKKRRLESESSVASESDIDISNISNISGIIDGISDITHSHTRQPTIAEGFSRKDKWEQKSAKSLDFDNDLVKMFAMDKQPLSSITRLGLSGFLNKHFPKYKQPSYKYLSGNSLTKLYDAARSEVSDMLKNLSFISFDTDLWSNDTRQQYMSLIGHCTFNNFDQQYIMLHSYPFSESHTGANINSNLNELIRKWNIPKYKVHNIVHDNAANVIRGIDLLSDYNSLKCFIHTTQLVIGDCILKQPAVINVIQKCHQFIAHFKNANVRWAVFTNIQIKNHITVPLVLKRDNETRWDSKHDMLARFLELKSCIISYISNNEVEVSFDFRDWTIMTKVTKMLEVFKQVTKDCSARYSTCSVIIPYIKIIKHHLDTWIDGNEFDGVGGTLKKLKQSAAERYSHYLSDENCILATYLDPRYKLSAFVGPGPNSLHSHENIEQAAIDQYLKYEEESDMHQAETEREETEIENAILPSSGAVLGRNLTDIVEVDEEAEEVYERITDGASNLNNFSGFHKTKRNLVAEIDLDAIHNDLFPDIAQPIEDETNLAARREYTTTILKKEIQVYNSMKKFHFTLPAHTWWKENMVRFPKLSVLARKYLSSPPSSAESERTFSVGGQICSKTRNRLSETNCEILMFLGCNLQHLPVGKFK